MPFNYKQQLHDVSDLCHLLNQLDDEYKELESRCNELEEENERLKDELEELRRFYE